MDDDQSRIRHTKAEKAWIDGALLFDRDDPHAQWRTDFELGYVTTGPAAR